MIGIENIGSSSKIKEIIPIYPEKWSIEMKIGYNIIIDRWADDLANVMLAAAKNVKEYLSALGCDVPFMKEIISEALCVAQREYIDLEVLEECYQARAEDWSVKKRVAYDAATSFFKDYLEKAGSFSVTANSYLSDCGFDDKDILEIIEEVFSDFQELAMLPDSLIGDNNGDDN